MSAPAARRIAVKLAASIAVSRSAMRQSSELPAKASIASVMIEDQARHFDVRSYHVATAIAARYQQL